MTEPRRSPYVWVSWVTGLLAGSDHCSWKVWFRAHFTFERAEPEIDLVQWRGQHAALVNETAAVLTEDGWAVSLEDQNKFHISVAGGRLGGKPDIVATRGTREALVVDCKTGKRRDSDVWQVIVYMRAAVLALGLADREVSGRVQYRDGVVDLPPDKVRSEE